MNRSSLPGCCIYLTTVLGLIAAVPVCLRDPCSEPRTATGGGLAADGSR